MGESRVASLRYRIIPEETLSFDNPPPVEWETEGFRLRLEDGIATLQMIEHYPSEREARERVEHFLRTWEVHAALARLGRQVFRFEFDGAKLVEINPSPQSPRAAFGSSTAVVAVGSVASTGHATHRRYPAPPVQFLLSPDAETLWQRYQGYRQGREPLAAMGYACITWLEAVEGGQPSVARKYNISRDVLRTLGRLTTSVGDIQTARKFLKGNDPRSHTLTEVRWVEAAILVLIRRLGEYSASPNSALPKITMADLPTLQ